jgi:hypothetical protein
LKVFGSAPANSPAAIDRSPSSVVTHLYGSASLWPSSVRLPRWVLGRCRRMTGVRAEIAGLARVVEAFQILAAVLAP